MTSKTFAKNIDLLLKIQFKNHKNLFFAFQIKDKIIEPKDILGTLDGYLNDIRYKDNEIFQIALDVSTLTKEGIRRFEITHSNLPKGKKSRI
jgi:hypothetical protein